MAERIEQGKGEDGISRRELLRTGSLGCAALTVSAPAWAAPVDRPRTRRPRSVILLWMEGGPSPYETFAPRMPGTASAGPFGAIPTRVDGLPISELLPQMAGWMDRVTLYRAVEHSEGSHDRAARLALTGRSPGTEEAALTLGEVITHRLGWRRQEPVSLLEPMPSPCAPHLAHFDAQPLAAALPTSAVAEDNRANRRHTLLARLHPSTSTHPHSHTPTPPPTPTFQQACLAACRQVEAGAPFVKVTLSGWDAHADLADTYRKLVPQLDRGFAALLGDLQDRGLLDETLVVWMGEFGRSPRINALGGRDHWPYAGCAVLAGGGIAGGRVIGEVDANGYPRAGAVTPAEVLREIYSQLGMRDARHLV